MLGRVLVVDDDKNVNLLLSTLLQKNGYEVATAFDGESAIREISSFKPTVILLDVVLPDFDGFEVMRRTKQLAKPPIIIMITGNSGVEQAVEALKAGAFNYIAKPLNNNELILVVQKAFMLNKLENEVETLKEKFAFDRTFIGQSVQAEKILNTIDVVAPADVAVIIQGESGTGKEIVANLLHHKSKRKDAPFVLVDCGAIPDTLIESELFGHTKGAFTGAHSEQIGKLEQANKGTIFLDEISNLNLNAQAKLLRVMQEKKICKVGSRKMINLDIRILVASNQNLSKLVAEGKFRFDLFHRLDQFSINIPPLATRQEDIPLLAKHFVAKANLFLHKKVENISSEAVQKLMEYNFPGNVRELENIIRKAVLLTKTNIIETDVINLSETVCACTSSQNLLKAKMDLEKKLITQVMQQTNNRTKAAEILGISRKTLYLKIMEYGI